MEEILHLDENRVDIWIVPLHRELEEKRHLVGLLVDDERCRCDRFREASDRNSFGIRRGMLRVILSRYLGPEVLSTPLAYGPAGKPQLPVESSGIGVRFNITHSGGMALYAVSRGREVGIDVELMIPIAGWRRVSTLFMSDREIEVLERISSAEQMRFFYRCWTRKEAFVKAMGTGLSDVVRMFSVSSVADDEWILYSESQPHDRRRWGLRDLEVPVGYSASLCVEGTGAIEVRYRRM